MRVVARPVVLVVQTGVEHDGRDARHDEGVVVGVLFDLPVEEEFEARRSVRPGEAASKPGRRSAPEHLNPPLAEPPDHVEVHDDRDGTSH